MTIRIAFDRRLGAYRPGGIARYARELHAALRELDGCRIVPIYARRDRARPPGGIVSLTPPHHRFERLALGVELMLHRHGWDVVHATDFIAPSVAGRPTVVTLHDLAFLSAPEELASEALAHYSQIRTIAPHIDRWIVPSLWTARDAIERLGIDGHRIHVVPHGVPSFLTGVRPFPKRERSNFVLGVGTIEPRKRYDVLLEAIELTRPELELVIVGRPGWNVEHLETALRHSPRVRWLSTATDRELRALYRRALAVAVPSRAEGFGFSALEAMACGTPVISSGGGALNEVTQDAAETISVVDPGAWALAIDQLAEDERRWHMFSAAGLERAAKFSWSRAARETLAVYRAACGRQ